MPLKVLFENIIRIFEYNFSNK